MKFLLAFKNGMEIARLPLEQGREYMIGRGSDCDLIVEGEKGISRQHFKMTFDGNSWAVQRVSKYGLMYSNGQSVEQITFENGHKFSVPPFEFQFFEEKAQAAPSFEDRAEKSLVPVDSNDEADMALVPRGEIPLDDPEKRTFVGNLDMTQAGASQGQVFLQIQRGDSHAPENVQLEGVSWTIGRDETCEVQIEESRISRKHFEISNKRGQFQVVDLGSANGTEVNGRPIPANQPEPLSPGDVISILDITITFQVVDSNFQRMLATVQPLPPPEFQAMEPVQMPNGDMNYPDLYDVPAVVKEPGKAKLGPFADKKKAMRMGIGGLLVVIILFALLDSPKKSESQSSNGPSGSGGTPTTNAMLTPDQQAVVRDSFNLARSHFQAGKFELCTSEIIKLHEIVPFYENSKELETLCDQAKGLQDLARDKERLAREEQLMNERMATFVQDCKAKMDSFASVVELDACLAPALELVPSQAIYDDLRNVIRIREEEKAAKIADSQARSRRIAAGESAYKRAKQLFDQRQLRASLDAYEKFLAGNYPDPSGLEVQARREIATVRKDLDAKVATQLGRCNQAIDQSKFKDAIRACDEALKEDPKHVVANETRRRAASNLKREMKSLYEDAIIEESLGNVDAAKEKWSKIVADDLPSGEYASKSKSKLKKYGVGM